MIKINFSTLDSYILCWNWYLYTENKISLLYILLDHGNIYSQTGKGVHLQLNHHRRIKHWVYQSVKRDKLNLPVSVLKEWLLILTLVKGFLEWKATTNTYMIFEFWNFSFLYGPCTFVPSKKVIYKKVR